MPGFLRTLKLYPYFAMLMNCLFWMPVFFLYLSGKCGISGALQLEAIYYCGVAGLEVPSGYFSDRIGRRITLVIATVCLGAAYLLFALGNSFWVFAVAELFLAGGFAMASGTDTSLLYETLAIIGNKEAYLDRESFVTRLSFAGGAVAAAIGGAIALISLPMVYFASFITTIVMLVFLLLMVEPVDCTTKAPEITFSRQLKNLSIKAFSPQLRFTFLFSIFIIILLHVPYEFYQVYLDKLNIRAGQKSLSPLISGFHMAATMLISSWAVRLIPILLKRFSPKLVLLGFYTGELILILAMALVVHPVIAVLLIMRSLPRSVCWPIIRAEQAPVLDNSERATFLSMQSLAGRLAYSGVLFGISGFTAEAKGDIRMPLLAASALGGILLIILVLVKNRPAKKA